MICFKCKKCGSEKFSVKYIEDDYYKGYGDDHKLPSAYYKKDRGDNQYHCHTEHLKFTCDACSYVDYKDTLDKESK